MKLKREMAWGLGCVVLATGLCWIAPEYGFSPVPFFALVFYILAWGGRLVVRLVK